MHKNDLLSFSYNSQSSVKLLLCDVLFTHAEDVVSIIQVQILEGGLSLHDRLAPPEVRPLHDRLVELFSSMKHEIKDSSSPSMRLSISSLASSTSYSSTSSSTRSGRKSEQHDTGEYRKPTSIIK